MRARSVATNDLHTAPPATPECMPLRLPQLCPSSLAWPGFERQGILAVKDQMEPAPMRFAPIGWAAGVRSGRHGRWASLSPRGHSTRSAPSLYRSTTADASRSATLATGRTWSSPVTPSISRLAKGCGRGSWFPAPRRSGNGKKGIRLHRGLVMALMSVLFLGRRCGGDGPIADGIF